MSWLIIREQWHRALVKETDTYELTDEQYAEYEALEDGVDRELYAEAEGTPLDDTVEIEKLYETTDVELTVQEVGDIGDMRQA